MNIVLYPIEIELLDFHATIESEIESEIKI